ncbi:MAG: hypothetical protein K2X99_13000 [Gemmatimonadaceae bacterium]|nr:hypothetical protein [Gemmatimonadaceae bacterium]
MRTLLLSLIAASALHGQIADTTTLDAVLRAGVARTAWRRAALSQRAGHLDSAFRDVERAVTAWGVQPAYTEGFVRLAAHRDDAGAVRAGLRALGRLGSGSGVLTDSALTRVAHANTGIADAIAMLRATLDSGNLGTDRTVLADSLAFPEGIDIDAKSGTTYITSLRHRNVLVVPSAGAPRWLWDLADARRPAAVFGVVVDAARDRLWVTTARSPFADAAVARDSLPSELIRVRRRDGAIEARWTLGDGHGTPGEATLAPDGAVLVTDAVTGAVYRLARNARALETIRHPLLRSPQGIVADADGRFVWIADWSHGLIRWEPATGAFVRVTEADGGTLLGIDGLRAFGSALIGVQNGITPQRVVRIELDRAAAMATRIATIDRPHAAPGELTVGAVEGSRFRYVQSSQWPLWDEKGARIGAAPLPRIVLREVGLSP